jgi:multidrug efflux pump
VQLSTAVISGLAFSTVLTLFIVPVMLCLPTVWGMSFSAADKWLVAHVAPYRAVMGAYGRPVAAPAKPKRAIKKSDGPANDDDTGDLVALPQAAE